MILITGHSRSGTGYMAALFRANGIDIGHEHYGKDGISAWQFAVSEESYPFMEDGCVPVDFDWVFVVIREPISCINSVALTEMDSLSFRLRYFAPGDNPFETAIFSIWWWYNMIDGKYPNAQWLTTEMAASYFGFKNDVEIVNARKHAIFKRSHICKIIGTEAKKCLNDIIYRYENVRNNSSLQR